MISDVLLEAADSLRHYLGDEVFTTAYQGRIRDRVEALVREMDALRAELDSPPRAASIDDEFAAAKAWWLSLTDEERAEQAKAAGALDDFSDAFDLLPGDKRLDWWRSVTGGNRGSGN